MKKTVLLIALFASHCGNIMSYNTLLIYANSPQIVAAAGSSSTPVSSESSGSSSGAGAGSGSSSGSSGTGSSGGSSTSGSDVSAYDVLITSIMIEDADGLTINAPGTHIMDTEVSFTGASGTCAISVTVSNVTIDLNGRVLAYGGVATSNVNGICISPGVKNIVIKNGTIAGFVGNGVNAPGTSGNNIHALKLENVTLVNNANGFVGNYINGGFIRNCDVNNNGSASDTYGISLSNSSGFTIQNTNANRNVSTGAKAYGFYLSACTGCSVVKSVANFNQGSTETAGMCIVDSGGSKSNYIGNCVSSSNKSINSASYGIYLNSASEAYVQFCEAKSNMSTSGTAYGIGLIGASNCQIEGNTVSRQTYGIYDTEGNGAETNIFVQNTAYQNSTANFSRPNGAEINAVSVKPGHLQDAHAAGAKDNISIRR